METFEFIKKGSTLTRLLFINIGVFIAIKLVNVGFFLMGRGDVWETMVSTALALPADPVQLKVAPWTLFSYMFLHFDVWHIVANVLMLYWAGRLFTVRIGTGRLAGVYLMGGILGGIFYVAAYNFFPAFAEILPQARMAGASAAVIALLVAAAAYTPNYVLRFLIFGTVRLWQLAAILMLFYVLGIASSNAGGNIAHLGGALYGLFFALKMRRNPTFDSGFTTWFKNIRQRLHKRPKIRVTYRNHTDLEYNRQKNQRQDEINRILDKISKSGYDALTREEKEKLFKMDK
ncbi:MAG: rhomboid family intramembrane serine protease [Bacteroidales bacterium]|jgi:membrane associated rhomboid family serine protease|nr:rhomboid family intramembrane serine protease [Bacteroidales bacterium]